VLEVALGVPAEPHYHVIQAVVLLDEDIVEVKLWILGLLANQIHPKERVVSLYGLEDVLKRGFYTCVLLDNVLLEGVCITPTSRTHPSGDAAGRILRTTVDWPQLMRMKAHARRGEMRGN
jgi:hypothetical protein